MHQHQNIWIVCTAFLCLLITGCAGGAAFSAKESSLGSAQLELISDAVFEVVVPRPEEGALSYEKPLPLDLLPYSVRSDKYRSIGTAFAIAPREFVSAAHVMKMGAESQFKDIYLRDKSGTVYPVDQIHKYSLNRDFVIFSLRDAKRKRFLGVNLKPEINRKVYAVGNALGQGIVIRDGLYTSETAEEGAGKWKWIRFSAAASPGNSGGPLLDEDGRVIGVILRKSPSENLNYAIPIAEVFKAKKNTAVFHIDRMVYRLDNMDMTVRGVLDKEVVLPMSYGELTMAFKKTLAGFFRQLRDKLLAENREAIFPHGSGSLRLLHNLPHASFPFLIAKNPDGNWGAGTPKDRKKADLEDNGSILYGSFGKTSILLVEKPDALPLETLFNDSTQFMNLILKSGMFIRSVGMEKIKITSMGKADQEDRFTDTFGRIWIVRSYLSEYDDTKVVTFTLPVPGGCVVIMRKTLIDMAEIIDIPELKILTDFVCMSYQGTFKEWRDFLTMKDLLPEFLARIRINPGREGLFSLQSKKFSFSYNNDVLRISDKSFLMLGPSFMEDQGKTALDIGQLMVGESRFDRTAYVVRRLTEPAKELPERYHSNWEKMREGKFPYNRSAYFKDKATLIETIHPPATPQKKADDSHECTILYTVGFTKPGSVDPETMKSKLDVFLKNLTIKEDCR